MFLTFYRLIGQIHIDENGTATNTKKRRKNEMIKSEKSDAIMPYLKMRLLPLGLQLSMKIQMKTGTLLTKIGKACIKNLV